MRLGRREIRIFAQRGFAGVACCRAKTENLGITNSV
jgi:hypothetical protein